MTDNNNLVVYCEFDEGKIADVSQELLTKGRKLADRLGVKLEALVLGDKLDGVEDQIFPYGADVVYKVEDPRLFPYTSNPHAAVLINLFKEIKPQICLMGATCIGRDLGPARQLMSPQRSDSRLHGSGNRRPHRILRPARNIPIFFIRSVRLSAATSWPRSSIPTAVRRWPPSAKA